jgi:CheY-like chemotaxis protein
METILLVEDSKFLRAATERILRKTGYRVICAGNGDEALELDGSSSSPTNLARYAVAQVQRSRGAAFSEKQRANGTHPRGGSFQFVPAMAQN